MRVVAEFPGMPGNVIAAWSHLPQTAAASADQIKHALWPEANRKDFTFCFGSELARQRVLNRAVSNVAVEV
jgi:hypothetical protein